ncbi:MAG: hypothetical protein HN790_12995 [Methylococcales bacterium]|mgnify:FL=1|nr:hypothetical protein [Methylococcales bacterium]
MPGTNNAIYDTAHSFPGGAKKLAEEMGKRPGTFNNKCDPNCETHVMTIDEVRNMMKITDDHQILRALAHEFGYACFPLPDYSGYSDIELLDSWADWDASRGKTVLAIRNALEDRRITEKELDAIEKEMREDFQKELALLSRLESISEKPQADNNTDD